MPTEFRRTMSTCLSDESRVGKPQQTVAESNLNKTTENRKLQYTAPQHLDHDSWQTRLAARVELAAITQNCPTEQIIRVVT